MILLALNELNIEYIKGYVSMGKLSNFGKLLSNGVVTTKSEPSYELLEPWIQWVTVHTGKSFDEHKVFRLGDIVDRPDLVQIFEELERLGLSVGGISAFNADNRLEKSKFFVPDPWTITKTSGDFVLKKLSKSISRYVNGNAAGKVGIVDSIWLIIGILYYVKYSSLFKLIKLLSHRHKPGVKAAILDMILMELFVTLHRRYRPDYSHLFFNGGAHIQHHYMFNSSQYSGNLRNPEWYCPADWDPLLFILELYDQIIGALLEMNERIIGVTGLHQVPHNDGTFYWRPISHSDFLVQCGVSGHFDVVPRMSRDFLVNFESDERAREVECLLNNFVDSVRNKRVFQIDNRGNSLFVEITYDEDIVSGMSFLNGEGTCVTDLERKLAFVAIKNGKHDGRGFIFSNYPMNLPDQIDLVDVFGFVKNCALQDSVKV